MLVGVFLALLWIPFHFLLFLAPTSRWAVLWLAPACIFAAAPFGIAPAAIQQMMPASMRGQASAVYLFILNLIGLGIGPSAVAMCTQYLFRRDNAVNYSLLIVSVTGCEPGCPKKRLNGDDRANTVSRHRSGRALFRSPANPGLHSARQRPQHV
jgi:hypothetical protein